MRSRVSDVTCRSLIHVSSHAPTLYGAIASSGTMTGISDMPGS